MASKEICEEPHPKCPYFKKYGCCGYCPRCPTDRQGLTRGDDDVDSRKNL